MKNKNLAKDLIWLRLAQLKINQLYLGDSFLIPIHLAFGHEALAVALDNVHCLPTAKFLTHRNIHYNLIGSRNVGSLVDEFMLQPNGLCDGKLGSMNLFNETIGTKYSSSILGNNLPVAVGYALGNKKHKKEEATV